MNREIKFRAWHKQLEMMGYLDNIWNNNWYQTPREGAQIAWANNNNVMRELVYGEKIILMQWTGLKDKNGKEIYEGDILKWIDWEEEGTQLPDIYRIYYEAPSFKWECTREGRKLDTNGEELRDMQEFEVIGNIYSNPELLEKGNND